jgi:hypothetical protein
MAESQTESSDEITVNGKHPGSEPELEYIPDSLTNIQLSIESIGFRKKLAQAFKAAITAILQYCPDEES